MRIDNEIKILEETLSTEFEATAAEQANINVSSKPRMLRFRQMLGVHCGCARFMQTHVTQGAHCWRMLLRTQHKAATICRVLENGISITRMGCAGFYHSGTDVPEELITRVAALFIVKPRVTSCDLDMAIVEHQLELLEQG